jgi:hypothetical protein
MFFVEDTNPWAGFEISAVFRTLVKCRKDTCLSATTSLLDKLVTDHSHKSLCRLFRYSADGLNVFRALVGSCNAIIRKEHHSDDLTSLSVRRRRQ